MEPFDLDDDTLLAAHDPSEMLGAIYGLPEQLEEAVRLMEHSGAAFDASRVQTIVVTIHQGAPQTFYEGPTREDVAGPSGDIAQIVAELDDAIDVVVSGHARLEIAGQGELDLRGGDFVVLPAHVKHRVTWTDPQQDTVWLGVFYPE